MTTYKVTADVPFDDHEPGEEFDADYDAELEARAIERGSITIVKGKAKKSEGVNDA